MSACDLGDDVGNRAFLEAQASQVSELIEWTQDYRIMRSGDDKQGFVFLHNRVLDTVDYVVHYLPQPWDWALDRPALWTAQCTFWRDPSSPYVQGLTQRLMFDYLLRRHGSVMSTGQQTGNVHDFWQARLRAAVEAGHRVRVVDAELRRGAWFDPTYDRDYHRWMRERMAAGTDDPRPRSERLRGIRYMIERRNQEDRPSW